MGCEKWNDEWVAHLYGELDAAEESRLEAHLAGCAACRSSLEELESSRRLLAESAPRVPVSPRVVVMHPPRRLRNPLWAFAAGAACASLLFAAGLFAGMQWNAPAALTDRPDLAGRLSPEQAEHVFPAEAGYPTREEVKQVLARYDELDHRVGRFESWLPRPSSDDSLPPLMTQAQINEALAALQGQIQRQQLRDLTFVLEQINETEHRASTWADETRGMLNYIMLATNPEVRSR